MSVVN